MGTWQGRGDRSVFVTSHRPVHCSRALCCHSSSSYCVTSVSCRTGVLNCFPRTVGSAPHQGACADLNRGCTWACRRLRRASTSTGALRACVFSLCRTFCDCNRELNSLPVVPTVYTCTCGGVHRAGTSSLYCTCACHGVPHAGTSSVLRRASTSTGVLRACVFSICRTFCNCNREFHSLPVVPTVYICTCGGVLCARTTMVCCTAPVLMYIALTGTREPSFETAS